LKKHFREKNENFEGKKIFGNKNLREKISFQEKFFEKFFWRDANIWEKKLRKKTFWRRNIF